MVRRRNESLLELVATLPWWVGVAMAGLVYGALKYGLPSLPIETPFFRPLTTALSNFAWVFAALFLMAAAISAFNAWRKGILFDRQTSSDSIRGLSWREFETLVGEYYRRQGYRVIETGGAGTDGGVDLVLKKSGETALVQCKRWRTTKVGVRVVRELYGVLISEKANKAILVTCGELTQDAHAFVTGKPIDLITGSRLLQLIAAAQQNDKIQMLSADNTDDVACPRCQSHMILRTARKGPRVGEQFWGCSQFPKCRGIRALRA